MNRASARFAESLTPAIPLDFSIQPVAEKRLQGLLGEKDSPELGALMIDGHGRKGNLRVLGGGEAHESVRVNKDPLRLAAAVIPGIVTGSILFFIITLNYRRIQ